uniref:universal stress protein n=1 Tax=Pararhizobium sp. IMCC3301 TaxID=3067904 RepID=UPI0027429B0D|nr:universal stress protein [Pararhizobium sp. IMCC3301]
MYNHLLVPVDLDHPACSDKAMRSARQIAAACDAVLHVMTVVAPLDSFTATLFPHGFSRQVTETVREKLHAYTEKAALQGLNVQHIVAHGAIYDQILTIAKRVDADLIVMASHRPELSDYLLGPNAAKVVRHANCSVMVVRD